MRRCAHVIDVEADGEFAVVHSDHVEAVLVILAVPALDHTEIADAVDAGVLPKINEQNMAAIAGDVVRHRCILVEPDVVGSKIRRGMYLQVDLPERWDRDPQP